jgi:hypothetical protein
MTDTMKITEDVPVLHEVDVLVAGGGPAGFSAAFAAARMGARTLVVEQCGCLGGVATAGGHNHICLYSEWGSPVRVVGGIIWEAGKRTADAGWGSITPSAADFELEGMKLVLERMAEESRAGVLYYTQVCGALVRDGRLMGVLIQNKGGRQAIMAKVVVDATGDGDVAALSGVPFDKGREGTGAMQPMTLMFTIGGVDYERVRAFRGNDYELKAVWKKAQEAGDMRPFQAVIMGWWWTPTRPDQLGINFTHINGVDGTRAEDLTRATIEGRRQAWETIEVYRKYVPGMENCHMLSTPPMVGVRETRRIRGEYRLTRADVVGEREFPDSVGYGSFFIDIHNVGGPGMDEKVWRPRPGFRYQIPWRILVPEGVDNLLVAGRCASADHEALGSLRVMPQCGVMGQAAGTAAALSVRDGRPVRETDPRRLQEALRSEGCILSPRDVIKA